MAACYFLLSIGILLTTHICMDRVTSVSYFGVSEKKCPCFRLIGKDMDCCGDEHLLLRLDDDQRQAATLGLPAPQFVALLMLYTAYTGYEEVPDKVAFLSDNSHPPPEGDLYKIHCSFVFYDEQIG